MAVKRRKIIVVGSPRTGKSFLANKMVKDYVANGGSALVYNLGLLDDFEGAEYMELLTMQEHIKIVYDKEGKQAAAYFQKFAEFRYFRYKDKIYHIKHFSKMFAGKAVKCPRLNNVIEMPFFAAFFLQVSDCLIVFDDSAEMFKHGLHEEHIRMFSKADHFGTKNLYNVPTGCDILFIMHSLEDVSSRLFRYINCYIQFMYLSEPRWKALELRDEKLVGALQESFLLLKQEEPYTYTIHPDPERDPEYFVIVNP
jgi:hypothetical protein